MSFEGVDGATIAAEVEMLRGDENKAILIVEGVYDRRFFEKFYDSNACDIVIAFGKANALDALSILNERSFPGFLCVVDIDYDLIRGISRNESNLVTTEDHDIEMMILKSGALEAVVRELGSERKVRKLTGDGRNIRELLLNVCKEIGALRLFSLESGVNLKFEGLQYRFITRDLASNRAAMILEVVNHSQRPDLDRDQIAAEVEKICDFGHDPWSLSCGHDLVAVLGRALLKLLGSLNANEAGAEKIERHLRLAYDSADFSQTQLRGKIVEWEAANMPYRILRAA